MHSNLERNPTVCQGNGSVWSSTQQWSINMWTCAEKWAPEYVKIKGFLQWCVRLRVELQRKCTIAVPEQLVFTIPKCRSQTCTAWQIPSSWNKHRCQIDSVEWTECPDVLPKFQVVAKGLQYRKRPCRNAHERNTAIDAVAIFLIWGENKKQANTSVGACLL